jgi:hypothetical protein
VDEAAVAMTAYGEICGSLDVEYERMFIRILYVLVKCGTVWLMGVFGPSGLDIPILGTRRDGSLGERSRNSKPRLSCLGSESVEMLVEGSPLKRRDRERDIRQHGALRGVESVSLEMLSCNIHVVRRWGRKLRVFEELAVE